MPALTNTEYKGVTADQQAEMDRWAAEHPMGAANAQAAANMDRSDMDQQYQQFKEEAYQGPFDEPQVPVKPDWEQEQTTGVLGPDETTKVDPMSATTKPIKDTYGATEDDARTAAGQVTTGGQNQYDSSSAASAIKTNAAVETGDSNVSNSSLVQNQLAAILGKDSPLLQQAQSRGEVAAGRMGLLGSSMGIGAAQGALTAQALEIAKPDAQTFAQANLTAQQAKNQQALTQAEGIVAGGLEAQTAANQAREARLAEAFQAAIKGADQQTAAYLQQYQQDWQAAQKELDREFEQWSTEYQVTEQQKANLASRRGEAIMNHQITTQELLGDPAFLALGEEAASSLLNTMADGLIASVKYDMLASGYAENSAELNDFLDDLADDLQFDFSEITFDEDEAEE